MKHIFYPTLVDRLPEVLTLFVGLTQQTTVMDLLQATLRYVAGANPYMSGETIHGAIADVFDDTGDDMLGLAAREGKEESVRQTLHEVIQEGLELKFCVVDTKLNEDLTKIDDVHLLRALNAALFKISTSEEYYRYFRAFSLLNRKTPKAMRQMAQAMGPPMAYQTGLTAILRNNQTRQQGTPA